MGKKKKTIVEQIDEKIQEIDNDPIVRQAEELLEEKRRLQSARRALLGAGPKLTGGSGGGQRVTQAEVVEFMRDRDYINDDGSISVGELAGEMGYGEAVIRGHLNRGKGERFIKHEDGEWSLNDPKSRDEDEDDDE